MDVHITLGPRGEHATRIYQQLLDAWMEYRYEPVNHTVGCQTIRLPHHVFPNGHR